MGNLREGGRDRLDAPLTASLSLSPVFGFGKPFSMCIWRMADKYTFMVEPLQSDLYKCETNSINVSSVAGRGTRSRVAQNDVNLSCPH